MHRANQPVGISPPTLISSPLFAPPAPRHVWHEIEADDRYGTYSGTYAMAVPGGIVLRVERADGAVALVNIPTPVNALPGWQDAWIKGGAV